MDYGVFHMSDDFALRTYANMVYQVALRYTQNPADAEDVFSDTFLAYYTRKPEFEREEHRKAWLIRVTINLSHNLHRTQRWAAELSEELPSAEHGYEQVELAADLGEALRQFAQYAAGEVPLSVKHAETGRLCRTFLAMAQEEGFSPADMGLSPTEYTAVLGTIQLGLVVKHGLEASDTLLSADRSSPEKFFLALRDYLSMKAVEQALLPHAAAHQEAIAAGETPISPIQILMGNPGFSARDIHRAVAGSGAMAELFSASPDRLALLLRSRADMSELACRTMAACYGAEPSGPRAQERSHTPARTHTNWGPAR